MEELTKEDWEDWKTLPQTKAFFAHVLAEQYYMMKYVIQREDIDSLAQARAIGVMSGLQKILDYEFTDES